MDYAVMRQYYESIRAPFAETLTMEDKEERRDNVTGPLAFVSAFSVLPVIPAGLYFLLPLLVDHLTFNILGRNLNLLSFYFLWASCSAVSVLSSVGWLSLSGPSKKEKASRLSPNQLRFALAYGVIEEIEHFLTNRRGQHIDQAVSYMKRLSSSIDRLLLPFWFVGPHVEALRGGPDRFPAIIILEQDEIVLNDQLPWLKLEAQAQRMLRGLARLKEKFVDRIRDKKDLTQLSAMLSDLAAYFYSQVPEIGESSGETTHALQEQGLNALIKFASAFEGLPAYRSEQLPTTTEEAVKKQVARTGTRLTAPFTHENVLVCFAAWYLLLLLLIAVGFSIAYRYRPELPVDTVVLSTLVGGPVAGAVTAVTVSRLRGHKQGR